MPTTNAGSRLAGLTFTDPQHVPGWTHAVLGARPDAAALPRAERGLAVEVIGAGRRRGLGEWLAETWAKPISRAMAATSASWPGNR